LLIKQGSLHYRIFKSEAAMPPFTCKCHSESERKFTQPYHAIMWLLQEIFVRKLQPWTDAWKLTEN